MSRVPGEGVSVHGLRRRTVAANPKSSQHQQDDKAATTAPTTEIIDNTEDTMDDIASVELGRKPSITSNGSDCNGHLSDDEEPRCDEALLKSEDKVRVEDEQSTCSIESDKGTTCTNGLLENTELISDTDQAEEALLSQASQEADENKDNVDSCKLTDNNEEKEDDVSEMTQDNVSEETQENGSDVTQDVSEETRENASDVTQDNVSEETQIVDDTDVKENEEEEEEDEDEKELSDEEAETRLPLQVQVITSRSTSTVSGRTSPVNSDCEVECAYIPTRVVVAAEHLRETAGHIREQAGHLREHIGEQAGHLREQIGEQAGHLREQIDAGAGQIVQFGGQIKDQVGEQAQKVVVQAERVVHKVKDVAWQVAHHNQLPHWLKDNDFLHYHHRPPLPSFRSCFRSIFRIHTETGNIWTHMIGCVSFLIMMIYFLVTSILSNESWEVIVVYMAFFIGAISCLGLSFLFHTCSCHSDKVARIFSKLDYSGISLLIVGSFIPWLYFGFYCQNISRWFYISLIIVLGGICLAVALKDKFGEPGYRAIRAALFIALGLSAVIPAIHFLILQGVVEAFTRGSFGWMLFMGALYIGGALLYAMRIPERFFPGKCDLMVQSHQIFHVMVVVAAFVHYHGLNVMAVHREEMGECVWDDPQDVTPYTTPVQSHQIFHVMVVAAAFVHYHGINLMAGYREKIGECIDEEEVLPYTPYEPFATPAS